MYSELLKQLKTIEQKNELLIALREIILELDQPNSTPEQLINKYLPIKFSSQIDLVQVNKEPESFFKNLVVEIENIPVASLEIGVEPTQNLIDTVLQWFDNNVGEQILVDFVVNPEIILGTKVGFKGKFFDGTHHGATK